MKENKDSFSNGNGRAVDGFEQDPFASSQAQEAFNSSTPDPFGSAFPPQNATVSILRLYNDL